MIAHWVCDVLDRPQDSTVSAQTKVKALALCGQFPVYQPI
jgi:glycine/serine hydroxymethyltransferase